MGVRKSILIGIFAVSLIPVHVWGHGFAGRRFFPATLTFDDPFVLDEFGVTANHFKAPGDSGDTVTTNSLGIDFAKRITKPLMFAIGTSVQHLSAPGSGSTTGFDNLEVGLKYLTMVSPTYESLFAAGFYADVGNTGSASVGADSFSTLTPKIFFGQGLGTMLDSLPYLRPLAVTGTVQPNFPLENGQTQTLTWGLSVQYNIEYLEDMVKYIGLDQPFKGLLPIVEFSMQTCLNQGCGGQTTGTINPGIIWWHRYGQVGLEASLPVNKESGTGVGVVLEGDLYLDDTFPFSLGAPIF